MMNLPIRWELAMTEYAGPDIHVHPRQVIAELAAAFLTAGGTGGLCVAFGIGIFNRIHTNSPPSLEHLSLRLSVFIVEYLSVQRFSQGMGEPGWKTGKGTKTWRCKAMWDNVTRQRYNHLRTCEWEGLLTEAEQAELAAMTQGLYDAEAVYLRPATARLQHDTAQLRTRLERVLERNRRLEALARRKEALLRNADEEHYTDTEQRYDLSTPL
jgi:hypothetical protein